LSNPFNILSNLFSEPILSFFAKKLNRFDKVQKEFTKNEFYFYIPEMATNNTTIFLFNSI